MYLTDALYGSVLVSGKCGHNFHQHCIMQWVKQETARGQCPMCRQSMCHCLCATALICVLTVFVEFEWSRPGAVQGTPQR